MNLSKLGRDHGLDGPRANMVVKEFLMDNGIRPDDFVNPFLNNEKLRRAKLKNPGS